MRQRGIIQAVLLAALVLTPLTVRSASLDQLTLLSEEYPPLNYTDDGIREGIATDLRVEMLAASGSLKSHKDIASIPWARGYGIVRRKADTLLYSMTRTAAREQLFQWVGPILQSEIVLLARKDRQLTISSLAEIESKKLRIGVVLDDVGHQLLLEKGVDRAEDDVPELRDGHQGEQCECSDHVEPPDTLVDVQCGLDPNPVEALRYGVARR